MIFEYYTLRNPPVADVDNQLASLGSQGWELMAVTFYPPDHRNFFFKRAQPAATVFVTGSIVLKAAAGHLGTVIINQGPTTSGGIYDCAALADANDSTNLIIGDLPQGKPANPPVVIAADFPFSTGLAVVLNGGTPQFAISYW